MFCDLLAQAPLNLERNVSLESVATFKLATLEEVEAIGAELTRLFGLGEEQRVDVIVEIGPRLTRVLTAQLTGLVQVP